MNKLIYFFLQNKPVTLLLLVVLVFGGYMVAPFAWEWDALPRDPVPVDAIPDLGENQQIVFTEWRGRSPQDVENQVTYPLTALILGVPGVKSVRSTSMFGFSSIYVIFDENVEFYWSRSRLLEKLSSLPGGLLPEGVQPALGPDATALGQVFWYTLEGRNAAGEPAGEWDLHELRSIQDYYVRYSLNAVPGVAEVASVGGFVQEYQVDIRPDAMHALGIDLPQVVKAVRECNLDIGARTLEVNNVEYFVRGLGYVQTLQDIEQAVVAVRGGIPVRVRDVARVQVGPAGRRGILDKGGTEAVGGVVVARYGANPLQVIQDVKTKIREIAPGLPAKTLEDGSISKVSIIPFYDRTGLIQETLGTLEEALTLEILITIIVVLVMVVNLRASLIIAASLPLAVLMVFIAMKYSGIDANIVALSGIAIAIGTMVDMGIVLAENILRKLEEAAPGDSVSEVIYHAATEVSSALLTAVATTVISFLPVFTLEAAEGKLFAPLAYTKTYALIASVIIALVFIPAFAQYLFAYRIRRNWLRHAWNLALLIAGSGLLVLSGQILALVIVLFGINGIARDLLSEQRYTYSRKVDMVLCVLSVAWLLGEHWMPLGAANSLLVNVLFCMFIIAFVMLSFFLFIRWYGAILRWTLENKLLFLTVPVLVVLFGLVIWLGWSNVFFWLEDTAGLDLRTQRNWSALSHAFPGLGKEFMPSLDEGSYLLMPTVMPHAGTAVTGDILKRIDRAIAAIPEVELVVGKAGRVESALDPAPLSMYENVIQYQSEYKTDASGRRLRFRQDAQGRFVRDSAGNLVADPNGAYFRQWRDHIRRPDDIWDEIVQASTFPGLTSAPKLQPIETRLIMLQTGMRAPMGIKVQGPDLRSIQDFGLQLERLLPNVAGVKAEAVFADRIVGKPYLQVKLKREALARYGLSIEQMQRNLEVLIGGMPLSTTVEGRERYNIRLRYPRELRDEPERLKALLVSTPQGSHVPLEQLADIQYTFGPQAIKSEDTFLTGYVLFDKQSAYAETDVVEAAAEYLNSLIESGKLQVPPGVSYRFAGNYENQVRAEQRLSIVLPLALFSIILILYLQFRSMTTAAMVFSGVFVAWAGGFIMMWLYGQPWFCDFVLFDVNMRELFAMHPVNLSVAVWVGFLALFGIATDDGVIMASYLKQNFAERQPRTITEIRAAVVEAGSRRIRPCLMTVATTILALLPVLTSTGRGSDIMVPMAIPSFGGMTIALMTVLVVPVLYSAHAEFTLRRNLKNSAEGAI